MIDRALSPVDLGPFWLGVLAVASIFPDFTALVFISGIAGGTVRWGKERLTLVSGLVAISQGGVMAVFLWPFAAPMMEKIGFTLNFTPVQEYMTGGFLIGLLCDVILSKIWKGAEGLDGNKGDKDD